MKNFWNEYKFKIKIVIGIMLILIGVITNIYWFYLGIIPFLVGITKFCLACYFLNKCSIRFKKQ